MLFRQLFDRDSCTYTYLLADETSSQAILIDPVFEHHARDLALLRELQLELVYTLDTHAHADHVTGAWLLKQVLGSKIALSKQSGAEGFDLGIDHGDVIKFGDYALEVRATPGHTAGCVSFVTSGHDLVFTGDCLLIRGAGRTDFQEGDAHKLFHSIHEQIFTLPDSCLIYPAHDYSGRMMSSVREERQFNARVGGDANETDFVGYMENLGLPHPRQLAIALPANLKCGQPDDDFSPKAAEWGPVEVTYAGIYQIEPGWVADNSAAVHLLDVRSEQELDEEFGEVSGAQLIPLDELRERISEVPKDKPVVTVCRSGRRSAQASVILRKAGYEAANLAGGVLRWQRLGASS